MRDNKCSKVSIHPNVFKKDRTNDAYPVPEKKLEERIREKIEELLLSPCEYCQHCFDNDDCDIDNCFYKHEKSDQIMQALKDEDYVKLPSVEKCKAIIIDLAIAKEGEGIKEVSQLAKLLHRWLKEQG